MPKLDSIYCPLCRESRGFEHVFTAVALGRPDECVPERVATSIAEYAAGGANRLEFVADVGRSLRDALQFRLEEKPLTRGDELRLLVLAGEAFDFANTDNAALAALASAHLPPALTMHTIQETLPLGMCFVFTRTGSQEGCLVELTDRYGNLSVPIEITLPDDVAAVRRRVVDREGRPVASPTPGKATSLMITRNGGEAVNVKFSDGVRLKLRNLGRARSRLRLTGPRSVEFIREEIDEPGARKLA